MLEDSIKITMLGVSTSGKTCYMIAMYRMMSFGLNLNGFSLTSVNPDDNVEFGKLWKNLTKQKGQERWPLGNSNQYETYSFTLSYSYKSVVNFDWFDYRGGALQDQESEPDTAELTQRVIDSSCIFICISGEHFINGINVSNSFESIGVPYMNRLIQCAQEASNRNIPPAVVIVITKYDLCSHRGYNVIIEEVKQLFEVLFSGGTKWLVIVCPVTLGDKLKDDENTEEIDPKNTHIPVIFSIYAELLRKRRRKVQMLKNINMEIERLRSNLFKEFLNRSRIDSLSKDANKLSDELDEIKNVAELISTNIDLDSQSQIFFDGQEKTFGSFLRW